MPSAWNPGTLATAGNLVFHGRAEGALYAYDASTGSTLWEYPLGLGIAAPPITYAIGGRQYVALLVGWGAVYAALGGSSAGELGWPYKRHMRRLVAFSLDGKAALPLLPPPEVPTPLAAPFFEIDQQLATQGEDVFGQCAFCHGEAAVAGGGAPDLRASPIPLSAEAFAEVVRKGRVELGMPAFESLSDQQLEALRHFFREQANLAIGSGSAP